jgi:hypothetical protein
MADDRVAKAVAARRFNSRTEDSIRKAAGLGLGVATAAALVLSEGARHQYGLATVAVSASVGIWRTGYQSL